MKSRSRDAASFVSSSSEHRRGTKVMFSPSSLSRRHNTTCALIEILSVNIYLELHSARTMDIRVSFPIVILLLLRPSSFQSTSAPSTRSERVQRHNQHQHVVPHWMWPRFINSSRAGAKGQRDSFSLACIQPWPELTDSMGRRDQQLNYCPPIIINNKFINICDMYSSLSQQRIKVNLEGELRPLTEPNQILICRIPPFVSDPPYTWVYVRDRMSSYVNGLLLLLAYYRFSLPITHRAASRSPSCASWDCPGRFCAAADETKP